MSLTITNAINLDLLSPGTPRIIHAKQGERNTRTVKINLYSNDSPWTIPSGTTFDVSYAKNDGTGGKYSKIGTTTAVTASGNALTVNLAPQMLQCAGLVRCEVHMIGTDGTEVLSTFAFFVSVQASAESGITSEDYWAADRDEKIVFVMASLQENAGGTTTFATLELFLGTPHVGDTVIGKNGYIGIVTETTKTNVTVKATGVRWLDAAPKVVLYKGNVLAEADVYVSPEADYFLSTPHIGDTVVGSNGYIGVVTAASGSRVTFKTTGARWSNPGLVLLDSNVTSVPDATQEYYWTQFWWAPSVGDVVIGLDGCLAKVTAITSTNDGGKATIKTLGIRGLDVARMGGVPESRTVGGHALSEDVDLIATDIGYTGKIGEYEVSNVGGAIEALVNKISYPVDGNYIDMGADYAASGAASVEQWATMAAETEDADDDAEATYRVNAGRYRIIVTADEMAYDVTVIDVPDTTQRVVLISSVHSDPFWYFDVYGVIAPGGSINSLLSLSTEESLLNFGDGCVRLLPGYDNSADSDDADRILMLKKDGLGVYPTWVAPTKRHHIMLTIDFSQYDEDDPSSSPSLVSATEDGKEISLVNSDGDVDYTNLINAIYDSVANGGNVVLNMDNDVLHQGIVRVTHKFATINYTELSDISDIPEGGAIQFECQIGLFPTHNVTIRYKEI